MGDIHILFCLHQSQMLYYMDSMAEMAVKIIRLLFTIMSNLKWCQRYGTVNIGIA